MKKALFFAGTVLYIVSASAQDDVSGAKWQPNTVTIDGNNAEWQKPFNFYDASTGLLFGIANSSNTLYLCFTSNDEMKVRKLLSAGWSIELDSKEKKKKFTSIISFPAIPPSAPAEGKPAGNATEGGWRRQKTDIATLVNAYKLQLATVTASGFKETNGEVSTQNKNGISINIGEDSAQGVIYELAIPLKELYSTDAPSQLDETITLNVTVNALKMPERTGGGGFHGGGGGGRGMGGGGRRMGGGGRGSYGGQREGNEDGNASYAGRAALFEKASLKQKFKLVNGK